MWRPSASACCSPKLGQGHVCVPHLQVQAERSRLTRRPVGDVSPAFAVADQNELCRTR